MKYLYYLIFFIPFPVLACAWTPKAVLGQSDTLSLIAYLFKHNYGVENSTQLWRTRSYPSYETYQAIIDLEPYVTDAIYKNYTRIKCKKLGIDKWDCEAPEQRKLIEVTNPFDRIDIEADIEAKTALEIINFVREEIIINDAGKYKYFEYRDEQISTVPLNLEKLTIEKDGYYTLYVDINVLCGVHYIKVQKLDCEGERCKYKIIHNNLDHII